MRIRNTVGRGRILRGLPPCALGTLIVQFGMISPAGAQQSDAAQRQNLEEVVVTGSYLLSGHD
jgi:hypothetical protein